MVVPDELTAKYSKGVDVFVTELELDTGRLIEMKYGLPDWLYNYTIDTHHTPHYATGYLINEVNPRVGMVTHFPYEEDLVSEAIAGIRAHWDGLFLWGAPDGVVVNVTKDAIWSREAAIPESTGRIRRPLPACRRCRCPRSLLFLSPEARERSSRSSIPATQRSIRRSIFRRMSIASRSSSFRTR